MPRILIVEDDPDIASVVRRGLAAAGYDADWADTRQAAARAIADIPFDAAIMDVMLGDDSGTVFLTDLRNQGHRLPVIMLSALARVEDRTEGLAAGAQDYVVKPFQLSELLARLEVQLHRSQPRQIPMTLGRLSYDPATRVVSGAGRELEMTEREGELLAYLIARPATVLTRGQIFDAIWAPQGGSDNVVDVYLGYLRRKLMGFHPYGLALRTLRGRGFMLTIREPE